jgi:hypothetical protein
MRLVIISALAFSAAGCGTAPTPDEVCAADKHAVIAEYGPPESYVTLRNGARLEYPSNMVAVTLTSDGAKCSRSYAMRVPQDSSGDIPDFPI